MKNIASWTNTVPSRSMMEPPESSAPRNAESCIDSLAETHRGNCDGPLAGVPRRGGVETVSAGAASAPQRSAAATSRRTLGGLDAERDRHERSPPGVVVTRPEGAPYLAAVGVGV